MTMDAKTKIAWVLLFVVNVANVIAQLSRFW